MADQMDRQSRLYQYRRDRKQFSCKVYLWAIIFGLLSLLQWLLMVLIENFGKAMQDLFYISIIGLLIALIVVTIFIFFEGLRFTMPINFILAVVIVEGVIFGLAIIVVKSKADLFGACYGISLGITILFIIIGVMIPHDLTLDVVVLFVFSVIFFFGSVLFVMLHILTSVNFSFYIFSTFVIVTTLMFLMYHAQTINGHRYAEMRLNDYLLAALIIYHDFVILMVTLFYLLSLIVGNGAFNVTCGNSTETDSAAAGGAGTDTNDPSSGGG